MYMQDCSSFFCFLEQLLLTRSNGQGTARDTGRVHTRRRKPEYDHILSEANPVPYFSLPHLTNSLQEKCQWYPRAPRVRSYDLAVRSHGDPHNQTEACTKVIKILPYGIRSLPLSFLPLFLPPSHSFALFVCVRVTVCDRHWWKSAPILRWCFWSSIKSRHWQLLTDSCGTEKIKTLMCKRVTDTYMPRMSVHRGCVSPSLSGLGLRTVFGENGKNRQEGRNWKRQTWTWESKRRGREKGFL